jgi:hypothetical protein
VPPKIKRSPTLALGILAVSAAIAYLTLAELAAAGADVTLKVIVLGTPFKPVNPGPE